MAHAAGVDLDRIGAAAIDQVHGVALERLGRPRPLVRQAHQPAPPQLDQAAPVMKPGLTIDVWDQEETGVEGVPGGAHDGEEAFSVLTASSDDLQLRQQPHQGERLPRAPCLVPVAKVPRENSEQDFGEARDLRLMRRSTDGA